MKKHIYFVRPVGMDGPVKIGCTAMLEDRIRKIGYWSPLELEVVYHSEGGHSVERALHERYSDYRLHGEWFRVDGTLKEDIERLRSGERLSDVSGIDVDALISEDALRRKELAIAASRPFLSIEDAIQHEIGLHKILVSPRKRAEASA